MPTMEALPLLRALADGTRLKILATLAEAPRVVEDLATRLSLATSTVSFHLKKLEAVGLVHGERAQYYRVFSRDDRLLASTLRELVDSDSGEGASQDNRAAGWRREVVRKYFRNGNLVEIPAQHAKRWVVLEEIARKFAGGRNYDEREIDAILSRFNEDHCTLRRALVDEGILDRDRDSYRLAPTRPTLPGSLRASYEASIAERKK